MTLLTLPAGTLDTILTTAVGMYNPTPNVLCLDLADGSHLLIRDLVEAAYLLDLWERRYPAEDTRQ